ncbi:MAG: HAMP domain-containing histidine kinase [Oscillospiraceae bacterium]|nr:HAMP domain-containing histidine kinase [Oscillospiraceae bacterium]
MILENVDSSVENFLSGQNIVYTGNGSYIINYRMFIIMRSADGTIGNEPYLRYFDHLQHLTFSVQDADHTQNQSFYRNGQLLTYRVCTLRVTTSGGETHYIQLATNVTDVAASLKLIMDSLLFGIAIVFGISLVASWVMVQLLVNAMADVWDQQDEFISFASHELRSPLAVVHNSLELLLQYPGDRILDQSELILQALSSTSRLRRTTTDMLAMASYQSKTTMLNYTPLSLNAFLEELSEIYTFQAESEGKRLILSLHTGGPFYSDRMVLSQIFSPLLENAIKYTEPGDTIEISTSGGEGEVQISVKDSGIGISEEARKKIFSRFYREENARAHREGSGLGLYIASLAVQRHGGKIKVLRNKGRGTEFVVTLPNRAPKQR